MIGPYVFCWDAFHVFMWVAVRVLQLVIVILNIVLSARENLSRLPFVLATAVASIRFSCNKT